MSNLLQQSETKASTVANTQLITYEQPLNESLRLFLHLESLFNRLNHYLVSTADDAPLDAMNCIVKILHTIDRPDLKTKLTQTLTQHATSLAQLQQFEQVNPDKLQAVLTDLDQHIKSLLQQHTKIGEALQYNELVSQLKQQSSHPSGICRYKIPMFELWLNQPIDQLRQQLSLWTSELNMLANIIDTILNITRNSTQYHPAYVERGFYQQTINPTMPCELLRIQLPKTLQAYPEFSVGKHRFTLRFMSVQLFDQRPCQLNDSFTLQLSLCRI
jgi:cell division protein ZapD